MKSLSDLSFNTRENNNKKQEHKKDINERER